MKKLLMQESTTFGDLLDVSGVRERAESRMIQRFLAQAPVFRRWFIYGGWVWNTFVGKDGDGKFDFKIFEAQ